MHKKNIVVVIVFGDALIDTQPHNDEKENVKAGNGKKRTTMSSNVTVSREENLFSHTRRLLLLLLW
jgi:hypothetical protein